MSASTKDPQDKHTRLRRRTPFVNPSTRMFVPHKRNLTKIYSQAPPLNRMKLHTACKASFNYKKKKSATVTAPVRFGFVQAVLDMDLCVGRIHARVFFRDFYLAAIFWHLPLTPMAIPKLMGSRCRASMSLLLSITCIWTNAMMRKRTDGRNTT